MFKVPMIFVTQSGHQNVVTKETLETIPWKLREEIEKYCEFDDMRQCYILEPHMVQ